MKALAPRIEKLYASEAERWRDAWKKFDNTLWSHLRRDEIQAYEDYFDSEKSEERDEAIMQFMQAWLEEVRAELDKPSASAKENKKVEAFFAAFFEAVPASLEDVDLTRWPEDVPYLSDEGPQEAQRKEDTIIRLCRTKKSKGDVERMAAALLIFNVAVCKTARVYSREKP